MDGTSKSEVAPASHAVKVEHMDSIEQSDVVDGSADGSNDINAEREDCDDGSEGELSALTDDVMPVKCGSNDGLFYRSKFARGSRGACILFKGEWVTPNEFQYISGRESCKDWKRSIRYQGRPMKHIVNCGLLKVHPSDCNCTLCKNSPAPVTMRIKEEKRRRLNPAYNGSIGAAEATAGVAVGEAMDISLDDDGQPGSSGIGGGRYSRRPTMVRSWAVTPFGRNADMGSDSGGEDGRGSVIAGGSSSDEDRDRGQGEDPEWTPTDAEPSKKRRKNTSPQHYKSGLGGEEAENFPANTSVSVGDNSSRMSRNRSRRTGSNRLVTWLQPKKSSTVSSKAPDSSQTSNARMHLVANGAEVHLWTTMDVAEFVTSRGFASYAHRFLEEEIDGEALLDLREEHLLDRVSMRLGPALKLFRHIRQLQCP